MLSALGALSARDCLTLTEAVGAADAALADVKFGQNPQLRATVGRWLRAAAACATADSLNEALDALGATLGTLSANRDAEVRKTAVEAHLAACATLGTDGAAAWLAALPPKQALSVQKALGGGSGGAAASAAALQPSSAAAPSKPSFTSRCAIPSSSSSSLAARPASTLSSFSTMRPGSARIGRAPPRPAKAAVRPPAA